MRYLQNPPEGSPIKPKDPEMSGILKRDLKTLNTFIIDHFERDKLHLVQDNDQCMQNNGAVSMYHEAKKALIDESSDISPSDLNDSFHRQLQDHEEHKFVNIISKREFPWLMATFALIVCVKYI